MIRYYLDEMNSIHIFDEDKEIDYVLWIDFQDVNKELLDNIQFIEYGDTPDYNKSEFQEFKTDEEGYIIDTLLKEVTINELYEIFNLEDKEDE